MHHYIIIIMHQRWPDPSFSKVLSKYHYMPILQVKPVGGQIYFSPSSHISLLYLCFLTLHMHLVNKFDPLLQAVSIHLGHAFLHTAFLLHLALTGADLLFLDLICTQTNRYHGCKLYTMYSVRQGADKFMQHCSCVVLIIFYSTITEQLHTVHNSKASHKKTPESLTKIRRLGRQQKGHKRENCLNRHLKQIATGQPSIKEPLRCSFQQCIVHLHKTHILRCTRRPPLGNPLTRSASTGTLQQQFWSTSSPPAKSNNSNTS